MLPEVEDFNALLAILGFLACLAAAAVMNCTTSHAMRFALCLIAVGLLGQALGAATDQWQGSFDTLLFGGILAWIVASRRMPAAFQQRYGQPLAWIALSVSGLAGFYGLVAG